MTSFSCGNVLLVADAERCAAASELVCLLRAAPATINQRRALKARRMTRAPRRSGVTRSFSILTSNTRKCGFGFSVNDFGTLP